MEDFEKDYLKIQKQINKKHYLDDYEAQINRNLLKVSQIQKISLNENSSTQSTLRYLNRSYVIILISLAANAFLYPSCVRFVKSVFKLKSVFTIHFSIIPILAICNAFILGNIQGYLNYKYFNQKYHLTNHNWKDVL